MEPAKQTHVLTEKDTVVSDEQQDGPTAVERKDIDWLEDEKDLL